MPDTALVRAAARNNAEWCAAVCRSHGIGSRFADDCWVADADPPLFYPRLVSLTADPDRLEHAICDVRRRKAGVWAVKDSFAVLKTGPDREKLFDAVWYARPGAATMIAGRAAVVESTDALTQWVAAWGETPPGAPIFVPGLLAEPGVTLLHDGLFQAGLAAYRSPASNTIGVTNFFGAPEARNRCIAGLAAQHPGCTITGYGPGDEAASLARLGFKAIAPLAVWLIGN